MKKILCLLLCLVAVGTVRAVIPAPQHIDTRISDALPPAREGGYILRLTRDVDGKPQWHITANDASGRFYAEQTRRQLEAEYGEALPQTLEVVDYPKLSWRGLHVDVSRHFFTVDQLKAFMDRMAALKLNHLHLHLTDGPGWRLQIKAYPRLTDYAAWRRERRDPAWEWTTTRLGRDHDEVYGGYFTRRDLQELIAYGRERFITIVPEIDIPGHSYAAICAYPELAQPGFEMHGNGLRGCDAVDVNNPVSRRFFRTVFDELDEMLPEGTPIHIGGDEVPPHLIAAEDQRKWSQDFVDYLSSAEREAITWDEAAINGVKGQTVMLWRADKLDEVLLLGHRIILTPNTHCYFDFSQSRSEQEPLAMGNHVITVRDVFELTVPESEQVIGLQGNLWSEYIRGYDHLIYMAFPRGAALAERAWGSPSRSYEAFERDLKCHGEFVPPPYTRDDQRELFLREKSVTPGDMLRREQEQHAADSRI